MKDDISHNPAENLELSDQTGLDDVSFPSEILEMTNLRKSVFSIVHATCLPAFSQRFLSESKPEPRRLCRYNPRQPPKP